MLAIMIAPMIDTHLSAESETPNSSWTAGNPTLIVPIVLAMTKEPGPSTSSALTSAGVMPAKTLKRSSFKGRALLGGRDEFHRQRVHTMARVFRRQPLAEEDVAQVSAAVVALDLDAHAIRVGQTLDRSRHLVVERRPAATGVELVLAAVELSVTAAANVAAGLVEVVVLAGEWGLRALHLDHVALVGR